MGGLHHLSNVPPGEKSVFVLAHMDTVFPPEHQFRECWVDGDELHGARTGDMKGGIAALVYAILALQDTCVLDEVPLTVVLVGDEEVGAVTSRPIHEEEAGRALACLVVEGAGANGEPATTQMAYRIGDSTTNIISPVSAYLPFLLGLLEKYREKGQEVGIGSAMALMIPYSMTLSVLWIAYLTLWLLLWFDPGPGVTLFLD